MHLEAGGDDDRCARHHRADTFDSQHRTESVSGDWKPAELELCQAAASGAVQVGLRGGHLKVPNKLSLLVWAF